MCGDKKVADMTWKMRILIVMPLLFTNQCVFLKMQSTMNLKIRHRN